MLVRLCPPTWRERYGEEFLRLIGERPDLLTNPIPASEVPTA